jgi:hypothetical protein
MIVGMILNWVAKNVKGPYKIKGSIKLYIVFPKAFRPRA